MNDGQNAKQQLVERIKEANNVLVTVSTNPSVDELAAALGTTMLLNGMNKHATAVVSGDLPPAINFLEPNKTFENSVDSLRDFIIALDKEKADHLRYKVDGDVVKIFITPYRTTINEDDLDFSQGDYNVELVLALNVSDKDHLDKALSAHGRILHDATVATLTCGEQTSDLGSISWNEPNASSLSEMLVAASESLKSDKPLINDQIATAYLTGIVAATDRFSNTRTSSKVMTMAAQLMAAGANQQLIAAKLEEANEIGENKKDSDDDSSNNGDGSTSLEEGESTKLDKSSDKDEKKEQKAKKDDGSLAISHEKQGDVEEVATQTSDEQQVDATKKAEEELADQLKSVAPASAGAKPTVEDLQKDIAEDSNNTEGSVLPPVSPAKSSEDEDEPSLGGTLNATTEQAEKDKAQAEKDDRNKTILSHNSEYVGDAQPAFQAPFNATAASTAAEPSSVDIFKDDKPSVDLNNENKSPTTDPAVQQTQDSRQAQSSDLASQDEQSSGEPTETLADLDKKNRHEEHNDAQAAVEAAYDSAPFEPANQPSDSTGAQPLGDVTHASHADGLSYEPTGLQQPPMPPELPPLPPSEPIAPQPAPAAAPDFSSLPSPPPLPPLPQTDTAPAVNEQPAPNEPAQPSEAEQPLGGGAVPPEQLGQLFDTPSPAPVEPPQTDQPNDPNQFKIPGQS